MGTLAAQIDATGISAPDFDDTLQQLKIGYWSTFGSDANLDPDSQDGQLLAIFARIIYDLNQTAISVYNSRSPTTAQGNGLSSIVKINGLARAAASRSQAIVTIVGQAGSVIEGGLVGDNANLNTTWALPDQIAIPLSGAIDVTVTCTSDGAVPAAPNTLTVIKTPTLGWQSVTNAIAANLGNPVEQDAALRRRQASSTALPSQTTIAGLKGALEALPDVSRLSIYENDTDEVDANGIPPHTIAVVIAGGDAQSICQTIALKKTPGTGTAGTTSEIIVDPKGVPNTIRYYPLIKVPTVVHITMTALAGYVTTTADAMKASVAAYLNGLGDGDISYLNRLWAPAELKGEDAVNATGLTQAQLSLLGKTFNITTIMQARKGDNPSAGNIAFAFNEASTCVVEDVTVTIA